MIVLFRVSGLVKAKRGKTEVSRFWEKHHHHRSIYQLRLRKRIRAKKSIHRNK